MAATSNGGKTRKNKEEGEDNEVSGRKSRTSQPWKSPTKDPTWYKSWKRRALLIGEENTNFFIHIHPLKKIKRRGFFIGHDLV